MKQTVAVAAKAPTRKMSANALGGALFILVAYALGKAGVVLPPEVAAAGAVVLGALAGYLTPYLPADE